jgi:hypothetical protein
MSPTGKQPRSVYKCQLTGSEDVIKVGLNFLICNARHQEVDYEVLSMKYAAVP